MHGLKSIPDEKRVRLSEVTDDLPPPPRCMCEAISEFARKAKSDVAMTVLDAVKIEPALEYIFEHFIKGTATSVKMVSWCLNDVFKPTPRLQLAFSSNSAHLHISYVKTPCVLTRRKMVARYIMDSVPPHPSMLSSAPVIFSEELSATVRVFLQSLPHYTLQGLRDIEPALAAMYATHPSSPFCGAIAAPMMVHTTFVQAVMGLVHLSDFPLQGSAQRMLGKDIFVKFVTSFYAHHRAYYLAHLELTLHKRGDIHTRTKRPPRVSAKYLHLHPYIAQLDKSQQRKSLAEWTPPPM